MTADPNKTTETIIGAAIEIHVMEMQCGIRRLVIKLKEDLPPRSLRTLR